MPYDAVMPFVAIAVDMRVVAVPGCWVMAGVGHHRVSFFFRLAVFGRLTTLNRKP